ncbi:sensor domain-containing protein [Paenibacillus sinopodophylli]|uniref:sensor domain-containing protein n=1 Tax=Paenibacillus sinopodophylli TaxID=1837342 RepID=UPI00110CD811|nr:EAL domain-containing protein [Paenibacillus sinopodophylli]
MSDYQSIIFLLLFIVPVIYLIDTSLVIIRRNAAHIENRLAFLTTAFLAIMIFFQYVQQLLPEKHTVSLAAYVIYPFSIGAAVLSLLLHLAATRAYHRITPLISIILASTPIVVYLGLLLVKGKEFLFLGVRSEELWKQAIFAPPMGIIFGFIILIALSNIILCLSARGKATSIVERQRWIVLFKANFYYQVTTILASSIVINLSTYLYMPDSIVFLSTIVWCISLRIYMKHDILPSARKKYELLYQFSPTAIMMLDKNMIIKEANPGALSVLGYTKENEVLNRSLSDFLDETEQAGMAEEYKATIPKGAWRNRELVIMDRMGKRRIILLDTELMAEGEQLFVLAVIRDITKQKEESSLVHFLAHHDTLTKLPNRYHFNRELETSLETVKSSKGLLGVMLVDLDRFKLINDTLGHQYGDEALKEVAKRLRNSVNERHLLARLGGDEFIILIRGAEEYDEIVSLAENIHQVFQLPITLQSQDFYLGGSIGISVHPFDDDSSDGLIKRADIAMYNAKHSGGNQYRLYTDEMIALVQRDVKLEKHLRKALKRKEFVLHYQPQVDLATGKLIGAEALIRWQSAELGMVHPGEFITLAEQTGLINEIGQWVIAEACEQGRKWQEQGWDDFMLSVNVSSRQFMQPDFVNKVEDILRTSGLVPDRLCLEITESMVVNNLNVARKMLDELVALGIHIAIDDFGTGYSSLSVIRQLPIAIIKIDRSFITDMDAYQGGLSIVKTIVSMGHDLQKQVVAEGVETQEQRDRLRQLGCDKAQGYYYHKPLPLAEFTKLIAVK